MVPQGSELLPPNGFPLTFNEVKILTPNVLLVYSSASFTTQKASDHN